MKKLFTLGTSDRPAREFIDTLKGNGITLVVDVRTKRGSRTLHFDESRFGNLSAMLKESGIDYNFKLHLLLGGMRNGESSLGSFRRYTTTADFSDGYEKLKKIVEENEGNTVIICCERDVKTCHRRIIAEKLATEGYAITHL